MVWPDRINYIIPALRILTFKTVNPYTQSKTLYLNVNLNALFRKYLSKPDCPVQNQMVGNPALTKLSTVLNVRIITVIITFVMRKINITAFVLMYFTSSIMLLFGEFLIFLK